MRGLGDLFDCLAGQCFRGRFHGNVPECQNAGGIVVLVENYDSSELPSEHLTARFAIGAALTFGIEKPQHAEHAQCLRCVRRGQESPHRNCGIPPIGELSQARSLADMELDAVIVPGGYAPDRIRRHPDMVRLVRDAYQENAILACVCHGGWVPVSTGIVKGKKMTSFFAIKDDMTNAGADWVDEAVVRDGNLISSRKPDDLPAFCRTLIAALAEREGRARQIASTEPATATLTVFVVPGTWRGSPAVMTTTSPFRTRPARMAL